MTTGTRRGRPGEALAGAGRDPEADPRRWWALGTLALAQLMLAVDGTIMNIALPSAQQALGMSDAGRQWVITVYLLSYGALLLLGGRLADLVGRRRALLIGLAGFTTASVLGGLALSPAMLIAARGLQGVFGALMTPAALALLSLAFPGAERARAYGIYGTIMGSGSAIGVVLGGVLTDYLSWRWSLLVNVPIALVAAAGALYAVRPSPRSRDVPIDAWGALLATAGLASLVYGLSSAETSGWSSPLVLGFAAAGVLLLAVFVAVQANRTHPLLPLRILRDRSRAGAYLAMLSWGLAILAAFLFLSVYLQNVRGYSPVLTGLAFLPYPAAIQITVRLTRRYLPGVPVRVVMASGLVLIAAGLGALALLDTGSSYPRIAVVFVLLGAGTACVLPVANATATAGAGPDSAVAGATAMTAQQIGGSLGTAAFATIAATATAERLAASPPDASAAALVHGFSVAGLAAAGVLTIAALAVHLLSGPQPTSTAHPTATPKETS